MCRFMSFSIGEPEQVEIDIEHNYIRAKNHATGEVSFEISKVRLL